jgi:3-phenylpropionate/trans-cinnamate dioxygenase ferredoxin reductase subunit
MSLVIVGGSYAASQIAASARTAGWTAPIVILTDEAMLPYQRPPLSKTYLTGGTTDAQLPIRGEKFYADNKVEVRFETRVVKLDRTAKEVETGSGERIGYDKLALATGARPRMLPITGADLEGVHALRNVPDSRAIRERLESGKSVAVIGGGFIGLEVAAVAATLGRKVTVLEAQDRLLARAIPPTLAKYIEEFHRAKGVQFMFGAQVCEILGEGRKARAVACKDGTEVAADLVLIGIGVLPNVELAQDAGIKCENGIVVDHHARTNDPDIVAAGDCTSHPSSYAGGMLRLESVQNALDQAKVAGVTAAGGEATYDALPWFWSDQYDMKLQMTGLSQGYDTEVLRGSMEEGKFSLFYLRGGKLIAADSVSKPSEHMMSRRMIAAGVSPEPGKLADVNVDLKTLIPK